MHILFFNMSEVIDATKLVDYPYFAMLSLIYLSLPILGIFLFTFSL